MMGAVWFDAGPGRPGRLLLVAHRLVSDAESWRIVPHDLADAWAALDAGREPRLGPVGTAVRRGSEYLAAEVRSPGRTGELHHWTDVLSTPDPHLGGRLFDPERDVAGPAGSMTLTLPAEQAEPLRTQVPSVFHCGTDDVLLSALALTVVERRHRAGGRGTSVLDAVEGDGRDESVGDAGLGRTVGWFTSVHPVRLDPGTVDRAELRSGGPVAGRLVKRVKEQLREVPGTGIGYGLLRYLDAEAGPHLRRLATPRIGFHHRGRFAVPDPAAERAAWAVAPQAADVGVVVGPVGPVGADTPYAVKLDVVTLDRPAARSCSRPGRMRPVRCPKRTYGTPVRRGSAC